MAKQFSIFATTCFLLVAFTSHCYAVTCVTLTGAPKPPTVVAKLGSISAILDADNQDRILEYYRYEVFGSATVLPIVDNNADGLEDTPLDLNDNNNAGPALASSFGNTYLYTARRFDDITGLYYYRNRYYDPRSGRFITRDPARSPWSNLYGYVKNRAAAYTDPSGLFGDWFGGFTNRIREELRGFGRATKRAASKAAGAVSDAAGAVVDTAKKVGEVAVDTGRAVAGATGAVLKEAGEVVRDTGVDQGRLDSAEESAQEYNEENPDWWAVLPDCPCENPDKDGVQTNDGWGSDGVGYDAGTYETYHPGAYECFRSYPTDSNGLEKGGPAQQCCYDKEGNLITGGSAAGTPDRIGSVTGEKTEGKERGKTTINLGLLAGHWDEDVTPFSELGWKKYVKYWPPNQGKNCDKNVVTGIPAENASCD